MTRIDFYVLPDEDTSGPEALACRLCEKAVDGGQRVHVHAPDATLAEAIDRLLWTFKQGSFVAHERLDGNAISEPPPAVLIGSGGEPPETHHGVLLNLGAEVPAFFSRFERVLEIVHGDAATRARSRDRFKFYRDRGYALESHKLAAA